MRLPNTGEGRHPTGASREGCGVGLVAPFATMPCAIYLRSCEAVAMRPAWNASYLNSGIGIHERNVKFINVPNASLALFVVHSVS